MDGHRYVSIDKLKVADILYIPGHNDTAGKVGLVISSSTEQMLGNHGTKTIYSLLVLFSDGVLRNFSRYDTHVLHLVDWISRSK